MTNAVRYTDVAGMPESVLVSVVATDDRGGGICRLEVRGTRERNLLFPVIERMCVPMIEETVTVPRDAISGGVSVFASMCPSAMMVPDLDERIRACRQGSGGLVAPIDHPPPPPAVGVPVAPKRCPSPSMGDCNEDTACRDARALFDIQNANTSNVCQRIRILQGEAEDLLRIYIALLILLAALFVALVILAFFAPSAVPAIVAVAAVVMLAAFITAAQRAGVERQIIALMDEARRLLATRSAAASLAERLCTCPGCGFPAAARATPAECIGIRGIEP